VRVEAAAGKNGFTGKHREQSSAYHLVSNEMVNPEDLLLLPSIFCDGIHHLFSACRILPEGFLDNQSVCLALIVVLV
jgi:hypothetical protein